MAVSMSCMVAEKIASVGSMIRDKWLTIAEWCMGILSSWNEKAPMAWGQAGMRDEI